MIKKRKVEFEIAVNEETLIKNYPNYKINYNNSTEFIDMLITEIVNMTNYENGYSVNISSFGNLIVEGE